MIKSDYWFFYGYFSAYPKHDYFKKIGVYNRNFSVCYPYGSYNSDTLKILKKFKVKFALTTQVGSVKKNNLTKNLEYPRYDTNDFKQWLINNNYKQKNFLIYMLKIGQKNLISTKIK